MLSMFLRSVLVVLVSLCGTHFAHAADAKVQTIKVEKPTVMQATAAMSALGGYMVIRNTGDAPDTLIGVRAAGFDAAEIHASVIDKGVAHMRPVRDIEIAPKAAVTLAPQGLHVMLIGNKEAREVGKHILLTLLFKNAGPVHVILDVVSPATLAERFPPKANTPAASAMDHSQMDHGAMGHH